MVERAPDPTDRRRNVVSITPTGRRQLRKLDRLLRKVQDQVLAPLSPEERSQLIHLLTRVVDHHARTEERSAPAPDSHKRTGTASR
jgi:MarR family transcriptional regulator, lower aerobic nicotinate degradation pathway regulator